jgi:hypothetical protein
MQLIYYTLHYSNWQSLLSNLIVPSPPPIRLSIPRFIDRLLMSILPAYTLSPLIPPLQISDR